MTVTLLFDVPRRRVGESFARDGWEPQSVERGTIPDLQNLWWCHSEDVVPGGYINLGIPGSEVGGAFVIPMYILMRLSEDGTSLEQSHYPAGSQTFAGTRLLSPFDNGRFRNSQARPSSSMDNVSRSSVEDCRGESEQCCAGRK